MIRRVPFPSNREVFHTLKYASIAKLESHFEDLPPGVISQMNSVRSQQENDNSPKESLGIFFFSFFRLWSEYLINPTPPEISGQTVGMQPIQVSLPGHSTSPGEWS